MKQFEKPELTLIQLANDDLIITSGCDDNICQGYDCPDCPNECTGTYHCLSFKCKNYEIIF